MQIDLSSARGGKPPSSFLEKLLEQQGTKLPSAASAFEACFASGIQFLRREPARAVTFKCRLNGCSNIRVARERSALLCLAVDPARFTIDRRGSKLRETRRRKRNSNKIKEDPGRGSPSVNEKVKHRFVGVWPFRVAPRDRRHLYDFPENHGSVGTRRSVPSSISHVSPNQPTITERNVVCPNNSRISDATGCRLLSLCPVILQVSLIVSCDAASRLTRPVRAPRAINLSARVCIVGGLIRRLNSPLIRLPAVASGRVARKRNATRNRYSLIALTSTRKKESEREREREREPE